MSHLCVSLILDWHDIFMFDEYFEYIVFGLQGMALLYLRLAASSVGNDDPSKRQQYLEKALNLLDHTQHNLRGKRMTFLCGDTGIFCCVNRISSVQ